MEKQTMDRADLRAMPIEKLEKLLTDRERLFVWEYIRDFNGTQAAMRAGYAAKSAASTAWRLLRKDTVAVYRDRKIQEVFDATGITPGFISLSCFEIYKRCMQKDPVLEWDFKAKSWEPSGEWKFDARGALRALAQMADLIGLKKDDDDDDPPGGYEGSLDGGEKVTRSF